MGVSRPAAEGQGWAAPRGCCLGEAQHTARICRAVGFCRGLLAIKVHLIPRLRGKVWDTEAVRPRLSLTPGRKKAAGQVSSLHALGSLLPSTSPARPGQRRPVWAPVLFAPGPPGRLLLPRSPLHLPQGRQRRRLPGSPSSLSTQSHPQALGRWIHPRPGHREWDKLDLAYAPGWSLHWFPSGIHLKAVSRI